MAKSDCGLSAKSGATQMQISREHYDLQWALAEKRITFAEYKWRYQELKKQGLVQRR